MRCCSVSVDTSKLPKPVEVPEADRGFWRVEEEFIGAIRGTETVKLTDFAAGVHYMEFTDAVAQSWRSGGRPVILPLAQPSSL